MVRPLTTEAGGPIFICESGKPLVWPSGGAAVPFNPDQGDLGVLSNADAVAAVQDAFSVWEAVPGSTISFVNAGPLPADVNINNFIDYLLPPAPDGFSAIVFDHTGEIFDALFGPGSGILGFAGPEWYDPSTCAVLEGVAFLNGPAFTDPTYAKDVMVHEIGHYAGLGHSVVNGQIYLAGDTAGPTPNDTFGPAPNPFAQDIVETMYPFYYGSGIGSQTLGKDDISAISTLYPEAAFSSETATIEGAIYASNGTAPLNGVNVIARNISDPFNDAVSAISGDFSIFNDPSDPLKGRYQLKGLTPGARYAVYIDQILAGGFSAPPIFPFPGVEEFHNGAEESNNLTSIDNPAAYVEISAAAGDAAAGVNFLINTPRPGEPLLLGDDGFVELSLPFPFVIAGQRFDSVFVNANGNLTFGGFDFSFQANPSLFLSGPPRIAGLWKDLNPSAGGAVTYAETPTTFSVIWSGVPEFPATGGINMRINLSKSSDQIDIVYGAMSALDGMAGVSGGNAVTSGFETGSDLSQRKGGINLHNQPAMFEEFSSAKPFDLARKSLRFTGTTDYNDNWAGKNDSIAKAREISLPFDSKTVSRYTEIEPSGRDADFFRFSAKAGDILLARVLSGTLDSVLGLFQVAGNGNGITATLVASDDDSGPGALSLLAYIVPQDGDYALAASTFPDFGFVGAGFDGGRYVLDVRAVKPDPNNLLFNGSFEFGGFLGWTAIQTGTPFIPWLVSGPGDGSGYFAPTSPQDGNYVAWNGFDGDGPMQFLLYQDVTIPASAATATLRWQDRVQWDYFLGTQTLPRIHAVQLRDPATDAVIETLSVVDTGVNHGPGDTGWRTHSVDISSRIGSVIRVLFLEEIPEAFTGPGQVQIDGVELIVQ